MMFRVAIVDVRSMHNVGAIFRTADGAGCDEVLICGFTGAPPDPRIHKVALGAEQAVPHRIMPTNDDLLVEIEHDWVVVLEQHETSMELEEIMIPSDITAVTLVVCGELQGAPESLLARADAIVELPMRGVKESLNVSVAFGIAAYAIAGKVHAGSEDRASRRAVARPVRPGVLTRGQTAGETPHRR